MIRILAVGLALFVAGSGAVMAQNAQILAGSTAPAPGKVETRLTSMRVASRDASPPQANAIIDMDGRVVPMAALNVDASYPDRSCGSGRRMRPAEIRKIAEAEAERIGLSQDLVIAVIRAEGLVGVEPSGASAAILSAVSRDAPCTEQEASIRNGVAHLARMRQLYPAPVHSLAAYREGEDAFLTSGGVSDRPETLRFIVTALNELATPVGELPASARPIGTKRTGTPAASITQQGTATRAPQDQSADPRWVSGFVFNLE